MLPRESDTRWERASSVSSNLDLDTRWIELSATSRILRVEGVGLVERDDFNTEDVLPRGQVRGNLNAILLKAVQPEGPPIIITVITCLPSVFQQLVHGPKARVAIVKDLDPNVTLTIRACRCEVRNFWLRYRCILSVQVVYVRIGPLCEASTMSSPR